MAGSGPDRWPADAREVAMPPVTFSLFLPTGDWAAAQRAARLAEEQGFAAVSLNDHFVSQAGGPETPQLECFTTLTAVAARTERVRLVPSVVAAAYRSPAMLAKIGATLDQVSGGRFTLGIGAGWNSAEYAAHGYPFPDARERIDRLAETIEVVKACWTQDDPCYEGRYFRVEHASSQPRPVQLPHPPIMVGGSSRRLLGVAARHADVVNLIPPTAHGKDFVKDPEATVRFDRADLRRRIELLGELAADAGRAGRIELGGFVLANLARDPNHPVFARLAKYLGFDDVAAARRSPVALLGTPAEVREELAERVEADGVTSFIVVATSPETQDLLAEEVLPAFA
jgi:probable F420-dependent oxidoreductase